MAAKPAKQGSCNTLMLVVLGFAVLSFVCAVRSPFAHIKPIEEELHSDTERKDTR